MKLVGHIEPVYCLAPGTSVRITRGDKDEILYVERVERRWIKESGRAQPCDDGSLRYFEPETANTNGRNPCLVFFKGEPQPWYFESGHDYITVIAQQFHGDS